MNKTAVLVVTLAISGCVMTGHAVATNRMPALRTPDGVCATTGGMGSGKADICFKSGLAKQLNDDGTSPYISFNIQCDNPQMAGTETWQMTVRKGKDIVYQGFPERSYPMPTISCASGLCIHGTQALVQASVPWSPGTYDVELVFKYNTDKTHRMTMTLTN